MKTLLAYGAAFAVLWSSVSLAQDQRQRSGRDSRGGPDSQSRLQRFDGFLKMFDVNGDGTIQPSEIPQERKSLFARIAQRAGLDPNSPVSVTQLRDAAMQRYSQGGSNRFGGPPGGMMGGPPGSSQRGYGPPGSGNPGMGAGFGPPGSGFSGGGPMMGGGPMGGGPMGGGPMGGGPMGGGPMGGGPMGGGPMGGGPMGGGPMGGGPMGGGPMGGGPPGGPGMSDGPPGSPPGFGPTQVATAFGSYPGGFGGPPGMPGAMPGSGGPPTSDSSSSTPALIPTDQTKLELQLKCQYYAANLLKQFDANHSGSLEKDEWDRINPSPKSADRSSDGVISLEELTAWVLDCVQKGVAGVNPNTFYRALTPTERLPDGLPDWFTRRDADADGQVSMAEFANDWSYETVAEFSKFDLNNDGFVTPKECLDSLKPQPH